jgi:hypothetical protein
LQSDHYRPQKDEWLKIANEDELQILWDGTDPFLFGSNETFDPFWIVFHLPFNPIPQVRPVID